MSGREVVAMLLSGFVIGALATLVAIALVSR